MADAPAAVCRVRVLACGRLASICHIVGVLQCVVCSCEPIAICIERASSLCNGASVGGWIRRQRDHINRALTMWPVSFCGYVHIGGSR